MTNLTAISDIIIEGFGRDKGCQNWYFLTTYILMINFLFYTVVPPGASKVDQTQKFDGFLNLTQLFIMTPYSVLIEMNDFNIAI